MSSEGRPHPTLESPFRGLRSFSESDEDAALFFGRDRAQELIVANLLASRFTVLYGQSGVGKSSILRAGVANPLRRAQAGAGVLSRVAVVYVNEWHADPRAAILEKLAGEARRLTGEDPALPEVDISFGHVLESSAQRLDAPVLLILDQFEQYLLYHGVASFDQALAEVVLRQSARVRCLISLREDMLVGLDRFKAHIPNLLANRVCLTGLSPPDALEAIRGPVQRFNEWSAPGQQPIELEPGLAEAVVAELQAMDATLTAGRGVPAAVSAATPDDEAPTIEPAHLQIVMEALWSRETGFGSKLIRRDTLVAMGGCEEIVRSHVEASLADLPVNERKIAARAIFYLITASGVKIAYSSGDLARYVDASNERVAAMLEHLCDVRIMRALPPAEGSRENRYEVFHDLLAQPMLEWRAAFVAQRAGLRMRWALAALSAAIAAALAIAVYSVNPGPLQQLELSSLDARFVVRGSTAPDRDIVIVDVDDQTLQALDAEGLGVALRPAYARLIDLILADDPKVIADDIDFHKGGDEGSLLEAIKRAGGRIVLVSERFDSEGDVPLFGREGTGGATPLLRRLGARAGFGGFPLDSGGVYRRMQFSAPSLEGEKENPLRSFAVKVAEVAEGHPIARFTGKILIDYHGPPHTFPSVSMIDVLNHLVRPSVFAGKIVVIGVSTRKGHDLHRTPFTSGPTMPGSEIQANAISTVRHGPALRTASAVVASLLIVLLSLVALPVATARRWLALAVFLAVGGAYLVIAQLLFDSGVYVPLVAPLLALALAGAAALLSRAYLTRLERAWTRPAMASTRSRGEGSPS